MEEELGRGHRKKFLSYKIARAANVKPSSVSTLPPSLFHEVLSSIDPAPLVQPTSISHSTTHSSCTATTLTNESNTVETQPNKFGLYKRYKLYSGDVPHDPDSISSPSDFREQAQGPPELSGAEESAKSIPSLYPFPNLSSFRLGEWFWSDDHEKSQRSFQNLLDIVGSDEFHPADVREAKWKHINNVLAASQYDGDGTTDFGIDDGVSWRTTTITIRVPISKSGEKPGSYLFTVPGFHYRPLVPVIKEKLESAMHQEHFHTLGCELRWKPGKTKEDVRVYGEMYNSPVFIEAYEELQVRLEAYHISYYHVVLMEFCRAHRLSRVVHFPDTS